MLGLRGSVKAIDRSSDFSFVQQDGLSELSRLNVQLLSVIYNDAATVHVHKSLSHSIFPVYVPSRSYRLTLTITILRREIESCGRLRAS